VGVGGDSETARRSGSLGRVNLFGSRVGGPGWPALPLASPPAPAHSTSGLR
jgi:hypothetical protein